MASRKKVWGCVFILAFKGDEEKLVFLPTKVEV